MEAFNQVQLHLLLACKCTACPKKKSHHLDLTKQIDKSFPLDKYCLDDDVSAGKKLFNPH